MKTRTLFGTLAVLVLMISTAWTNRIYTREQSHFVALRGRVISGKRACDFR